MQLLVTELQQNGKKLYFTALPIHFLKDEGRIKVDQFDPTTKEGYQRKASSARARDFARYIGKAKGISPTTVLLNVRGELGEFTPIKGAFGTLNLPDQSTLWLVDGQHRMEGFQELLTSDTYTVNGQFEIPAIIMAERNEYEEAKQFIIINKTQKGVRPDLAERFIARLARKEGVQDLYNLPRATTRDLDWRPRATEIVDILDQKKGATQTDDFYGNPWFGRIQMPNEPKGENVVSQKAFEDSLKPILNSDFIRSYSPDEVAVMLVRYWRALKNILPHAFDDPKSYVLQRTMGVFVFHRILPRAISIATRGSGKLTIKSLQDIFSTLGDPATEMFWSVDGVAGQLGSSNKAVTLLTSKLADALEETNRENTPPGKPFTL